MQPPITEPDALRFFALGLALARGAFAYAGLAGAAGAVAQTRSRVAQAGQLAKLAPVAEQNRETAGEHIAHALALMRALDAPPAVLASVAQAAVRLAGPVPVSGNAKPLLLFNRDAARVLSSLAEFGALSSLPEDPALQCWLGEAGAAETDWGAVSPFVVTSCSPLAPLSRLRGRGGGFPSIILASENPACF